MHAQSCEARSLGSREQPPGQGQSHNPDDDIVVRRWLLVDVDADRPAGISTNDEELDRAKHKVQQIRKDLTLDGWPLPICAMSGNGYHLLYRIDLPVDDHQKIKNVVLGLHHKYSDDHVTIDKVVHNQARITKVIGTEARKGDSTESRPHRRSKLLEVPDADC